MYLGRAKQKRKNRHKNLEGSKRTERMSDAIFPNLWPVINYLTELWVKAFHQPRYIIASDLLTVDSCSRGAAD